MAKMIESKNNSKLTSLATPLANQRPGPNDTGRSMKARPPLTSEERRLASVFYMGSGVFIVLGYALYFAALSLPPPAWALQLIDTLKPTLGALATAELVSESPFPAQAVIVYSVLGFVVLSAWFAYENLFSKDSRAAVRNGLVRNTGNSRGKFFFGGCVSLLGLYLWIWFTTRQDTVIGWQELALLSPNLGPITMQLLMASFLPLAFTRGLYALWAAVFWRLTPDASSQVTQSDQGG